MAKTKRKPIQNKKTKEVEAKESSKLLYGSIVCVVVAILTSGWLYKLNEHKNYVSAKFAYDKLNFNTTCKVTEETKQAQAFPGCTPTKVCGRGIRDLLISEDEISVLQGIANRSFAYSQSAGGASVFDMHTGALSRKDKFINVYKSLDHDEIRKIFNESDLQVYKQVKDKISKAVASEFGLNEDRLYLTSPTFFSQMTNKQAKTKHDEYWHVHIDKIQYGSFDYTSLLYLSTYANDFTGGRFMFDSDPTNNLIVEPKVGRVSFFTSGAENPHHVEKVLSGIRYAITVSFTCDPRYAIEEPSLDY